MESSIIVVVGVLGLFLLISLSLIGSFECSWLLMTLGTIECFDDILSVRGSFERYFVQEISFESFDVVDLFDDVTLNYFFVK